MPAEEVEAEDSNCDNDSAYDVANQDSNQGGHGDKNANENVNGLDGHEEGMQMLVFKLMGKKQKSLMLLLQINIMTANRMMNGDLEESMEMDMGQLQW